MTTTAEDFDALYRDRSDPWSYRTRWYEERKRQLTLACLPDRRFASAYEPGCGIGEFSAALATRCDRLLASDGSAVAVETARLRSRPLDHVRVDCLWMPDEWPQGFFDLIVLSEFVYYLSPRQLQELIQKLRQTLRPHAAVLACHWRRRFAGTQFDGDEVQAALHHALQMPRLMHLLDADLRLDVWSTDSRSVAEREGIA